MGAQNGANRNGDLLDVLSEYAPKYAEMGLTADDMMQTLISGAENGVFQIDKVGDAVKVRPHAKAGAEICRQRNPPRGYSGCSHSRA